MKTSQIQAFQKQNIDTVNEHLFFHHSWKFVKDGNKPTSLGVAETVIVFTSLHNVHVKDRTKKAFGKYMAVHIRQMILQRSFLEHHNDVNNDWYI